MRAWASDGGKYRELTSSAPIHIVLDEMSDPLERAIWKRA